MRIAAGLLLGAAIAACAGAPTVAVGVVVEVDTRSLTDVSTFTIRTQEGTSMTFAVGALELDAGGFPASHLAQHMLTAQPIAIAFRDDTPYPVAYRLVDAPWARP